MNATTGYIITGVVLGVFVYLHIAALQLNGALESIGSTDFTTIKSYPSFDAMGKR